MVSPDISAEETDTHVDLIAAVRRGDRAAFGKLYTAHVHAAHHLARQLSRADEDDLVAEAFSKVLAALLDTRDLGLAAVYPGAFRGYLLTTLRRTFYSKVAAGQRVTLVPVDALAKVSDTAGNVAPSTSVTAMNELEGSLACRAFAALPLRWQAVLWHTVIEERSPAEVAPHLGLSPNGVAALALRAREGLRWAYLQQQVTRKPAGPCGAVMAQLGGWTRAGLGPRQTRKVRTHLAQCERCRAAAAEVRDTNAALAC